MPELPDLQVFSQNLQKKLAGKKVKKVVIGNAKKLKASANMLKKSLEKQVVKKVYREGKELHFQFGNGDVLGLHLMLKGRLYLFEGKNEQKYTIIELQFDDGTGLALTDFQGQATPTLNPEEREAPDALSTAVNYSFLKKALQTKATIKNLLLDQHVIRGIGNAYADEILWKAGISPFSIANKIPDNKIKSLASAIKSVLKNAEKQIRKSDPDIISGEVRDFLDIHNSKKKSSPTGATIEHAVVGSRKTYYTKEQELYK
ncbi:MAG TPA: DNA-formamidopyrimidine glycosylase family protein [Chitinophagaceae bacterium]|nr:DNA-formamidopyrimidine glycosylase family protein [Chitinophagaceae bacterium]